MERHLAPTHDRRGCLLLIVGCWLIWGGLIAFACWWVKS